MDPSQKHVGRTTNTSVLVIWFIALTFHISLDCFRPFDHSSEWISSWEVRMNFVRKFRTFSDSIAFARDAVSYCSDFTRSEGLRDH
jgi:hypothetical protein